MSGSHRGTKFTFLASESHKMNARDKMSSEQDELEDYIEIKHEEVDFPHNSSSHSDFEVNFSLPTVQNILHVDCGPDKVEEKDLDDFYLDILKSDRCCEICQKYMKMLSRHVRSAHAPLEPQSIQDPLHIDPELPERQQSSSIEIKSEIDDCCIDEKVEVYYSEEESESKYVSDQESEYDGESDPDYSPPSPLTRSGNSRHQRHLVRNDGSSEPTTSKTKNVTQASPQHFKCDKCDQSFNLLIHLETHMRIHTGKPKPFKCGECEKSYALRSSLKEHRRLHTGEKPYVCTMCSKSYNRTSGLAAHKKVHTGERPYKCGECGKCFTASSHLTIHKRHHTGEKPYECTLCEKKFTARSYLNVHIKVHTGEIRKRLYKCDKCERSFSNLINICTCYMK